MGYQAPFPESLKQVEFLRIYLHLRLVDELESPYPAMLQLRRELIGALNLYRESGGAAESSALQQILMPAFPADSSLVRQVGKAAPALVLSPDISVAESFQAGHLLILPVVLIGPALHQYRALIRLFELLGEQGFYKGQGHFNVEMVEAEDASGLKTLIQSATDLVDVSVPICDLSWWLEGWPPPFGEQCLSCVSPVRLMRRGKPLFKASFADLFPYVLRRVSSLLACYGSVDIGADAGYLMRRAEEVETVENRLRWRDWRRLENLQGGQNLGGLGGHLIVSGEALAELAWIIQLGSLFNIGKGAAFGAGQYRFKSVVS